MAVERFEVGKTYRLTWDGREVTPTLAAWSAARIGVLHLHPDGTTTMEQP